MTELALFPEFVELDQAPEASKRIKHKVQSQVAACIVVRNDKLLLIRRDIDGLENHWVFPAGKIESGESPFDAAAREVMEETGVYCRPIKIVSTRIHPINGLRFAYVLCEFVGQAANPRREYKVKWFGAHYVPRLLGPGITKSVASAVAEIRNCRGVRQLRRKPNRRHLPLLKDAG